MQPRTASIHLNGPTGTVILDGQDISHCIRGFTLTADAGDIPTLDLDVVLHEADVEGQALVHIPARTAELLTALGWTPPAGYDPEAAKPVPSTWSEAARMAEALKDPANREAVSVALRTEARVNPEWIREFIRREERLNGGRPYRV
ncbi:hypothetical protein [Streptomyces sp. NPDC058394]|uniref:hypothetical protein n=1 Tax=Streptomyces sp. NPDC058394 TaxID=3346477 RepID=UPI003647106F